MIVTVAFSAVLLFCCICVVWYRGRSLDEGFDYHRWVYYTEGSSDRDTSICWGPHGIRFWFWKDDRSGFDDIEPIRMPPGVETEGLLFRSEPYDQETSWGWPIDSSWNYLGFWFSHEHYSWEHESRHILLVAAPFWFCALVALTVFGAAILFKCRLSRKKPVARTACTNGSSA
jgi:hypothetical protein